MRVIEAGSYSEMSERAAAIIAAQMILKPDSVLGLATGSSPVGTYESLVKKYDQGIIDFDQTKTFNLDEYVGLPPTNDQSYRYFMEENLFSHVNVKSENINFLDGMTANIQGECQRYEQRIEEIGGIDLQLLGMGHNGHIAFNEPAGQFVADTHLVELSQSTIDANKRFFESGNDVPRQALTMGVASIMKARTIVMVVSGEEKAEAVRKAIEGSIVPEVSASVLQMHPDVYFIADSAALSLLKG